MENAFGKVWKSLEKFGKVWKSLEVWKSSETHRVCKSLENIETFWTSLEKFGKVWKSLERFAFPKFGKVGKRVLGCRWLPLASVGFRWLSRLCVSEIPRMGVYEGIRSDWQHCSAQIPAVTKQTVHLSDSRNLSSKSVNGILFSQ